MRPFFTFVDKIFIIFFTLFIPFIVLKTTVLNTRFQRKNRFEKWPSLGWVIWEKPLLAGGLVWRAMLKNIFVNILAQGGSFFKPIFALKPWDQDGCFEYNKRYKRSKKVYDNFVHKRQKSPQKPKILGKLELIGQKRFSFRYLWPLIEWNQVKYPIHQNLCYTV